MSPNMLTDPQYIYLSPMDNVMPRFYARLIFAFRCSPNQDHQKVRGLLEQGLRRTSADIPSIAGKVFTRPATPDRVGHLEIRVHPSYCPTVYVRDFSELDYDELLEEGLPQDMLDPNILFPVIDPPDSEQGAPIFLAQANFVTGGLLLAVGMYHSVIDGTSGGWLAKKWAEHTRHLQGTTEDRASLNIMPRSTDPGVLEDLWLAQGYSPLTVEELKTGSKDSNDPTLWRLLGLDPLNTPPSPQLMAEPEGREDWPMQSTIFYLSPQALEDLKKASTEEPFGRVSTNDALMALLWRSITRARLPNDTSSSMDTNEAILDSTYDGRAGFSPDLPFTYMGSLIFISTARMQRSQLVSPTTSLASIAHEIRQAAKSIDSSRMHAAFGLAASIPDYTKLTFPFATFAGAEVCITSWIAWSLFDLDFGPIFANGGRPEFVRPPRREFDAVCRRCVVLPLQSHGGCEVLISLVADEMQRLERDPELARFACVACH
ncbi:Transferase [Penicillium expansum]|uniref:Transferase n=1 Tax=Penicillium expansum TaxID=27334 RepID=A0A0A2K337_PENEN|nr:Transferase [Penicillium expansum]KGO48198.1 Transferase [Penicillium expansum]KGO61323.1 Transferase [Penicillium expansum]